MRYIRLSRKRKFRRKHSALLLFTKIFAIWYCVILCGIYLNSYTKATFNDLERVRSSLHVLWEYEEEHEEETDWDKSSFYFTEVGGGCTGIFAVIKNGNDSGDANRQIPYEILWAERGNAKDGTIVSSGYIDGLAAGETKTINHLPEISGKYRFNVYQHPKHPGKGITTIDIQVDNCINSLPLPPLVPDLDKEKIEEDKEAISEHDKNTELETPTKPTEEKEKNKVEENNEQEPAPPSEEKEGIVNNKEEIKREEKIEIKEASKETNNGNDGKDETINSGMDETD